MADARTPADLVRIRDDAQRRQMQAADPAVSAWVAANAGTGKTHVLTTRVLRLMLAGTPPDRILALTYTKAAAAEMSKRVFDRLAAWTTMPRDALATQLAGLIGRSPTAADIRAARALFAGAIETPGGLKVQTIHAFCERLLQRFPLEAGVPPHFQILDDQSTRELRRGAIDDMLALATDAPASELGRALTAATRYAIDDGFDTLLADALAKRDWVEAMATFEYEGANGFAAAERLYRQLAGVRASTTPTTLAGEMAGVLGANVLARAIEVLGAGKVTDQKLGAALTAARAATSDTGRIDALRQALLTKDGSPRADGFVTKAVKEAEPQLFGALCAARDRLASLDDERAGLDVVAATLALLRLADAVLAGYVAAKARQAALDFDDLIRAVDRLLSGVGEVGRASATEWVLFKLDGGLDHILVDEAQDTSPAQWKVIEALAREFFAGAGAREEPRTLFAVGDEKQSIYGFQGADPKKFAAMGRDFAAQAAAAKLPWVPVAMTLSYRTVVPVLAAVDQVFAEPARAASLTAGGAPVHHLANRQGQAGRVELWETEKPIETATPSPWQPYADAATSAPMARLAARIAETIDGWLKAGEMLASAQRPVRAGDILILVRRRRPFAPAMVAALKDRGIAVAGADRMRLTEQIVVEDLMALGDFLVLPEDDLALAEVLKSPLFDLDDDDLLALAVDRRGTLWRALLAQAETNPRFAESAGTLRRWRGAADYAPPYEFFARLLDAESGRMRTRLLARLGAEAADPLDEFLAQALAYDERHPPSMQGFLTWLRASAPEVKRDMEQGRNEVRVMTVHGAKGLEAPIVFLPDTCSTRSGGRPGGLVKLALPASLGDLDDVLFWPVKGSSRVAAIGEARKAEAEAANAERHRLLYVAMTRARDRLYVAGFEGKSALAADSWYELVRTGLGATLIETADAGGRRIWRHDSTQDLAPETERHAHVAAAPATDLPAWAKVRAAREVRLAIPLAPSRLAPLETDAAGEPRSGANDRLAEPVSLPPSLLADQSRFLRGTLTHALLQHLPELPETTWHAAAPRFVAERGAGLRPAVQAGIAREVLAVLANPAFAPLFGPGSQAEVPIVAEIPRPQGRGPALRIAGQVDRLAVLGDTVIVIDYKTNRPPPADAEGVADAYLLQLAAYRMALARIFPGKTLRAAILWTDGPRIMEIPPALLDRFEVRLWSLDPARDEHASSEPSELAGRAP